VAGLRNELTRTDLAQNESVDNASRAASTKGALMERRILFAISAVACLGCVTAPLERYGLNQSLSTSEMRYQEVMNALAIVAHNRGTLPSYSVISSGTTNVTHTVSMEATTSWTRAAHNFGQQILNVLGKHSPELNWTLDPVAEPVLLQGAWYACYWALFGPLPEGSAGYDLLRKPTIKDIVGCDAAERNYHLWAFDDRHQIPYGWLGVGPRGCVPRGACYTAHCGETYIWVMPDQMYHLSEFTLVLMDIATTAPTWYAQQKQQATATVDLGMPGSADPTKSLITETWAACQVNMADGSTKIVVQPFAEPPPEGTNEANRFIVSRVIEKSTLSLYVHPSGKALQGPLKTDTPQTTAPGAPQSSHIYRQ
jgi:hypothetical protein